jgi:hypothetical protein
VTVKDKAREALVNPVAQRLHGERPGPVTAAAGATVAGALTGVVVFRLLRSGGEDSHGDKGKN